MFGFTFYHGMISKYMVLFATLFNDIQIERHDVDGTIVSAVKIPINYGPRDVWLARVEADPELNRPYSKLMPSLSFEMTEVDYSSKRKLATTQSFVSRLPDNPHAYSRTQLTVPVDIHVRMSIMAKTAEDAHKIFEQIRPFFTPDWTVTAHLLDDMPDISLDIPIELVRQQYYDDYDAAYEKRRVVGYHLDFVIKGYIFGPTSRAKVIKIAKVTLIPSFKKEDLGDRVTVRPGLTADGQPTTDPELSIPYTQIEENDNYGYIVTVENDVTVGS